MTASFNLVDQPWIPCVLPDGSQVELGLRGVLARAHEIGEIAGELPPVTVALHRLLLALLHRCLGPEHPAAWQELWERGTFDMAAIDDYLHERRHRFDLFDERQPFYQTADVSESGAGSAAKLLFQADNNPTLFDHAVANDPPNLTAARAARLLLMMQSFDTGGLKTGTGDEKFAKAGPLIQCAITIVRGANLFQTLLLNLQRYCPEDGRPWEFDRAKDLPAWERDGDTRPQDRYPDGYLDLLTWQSRRIRLLPEVDADGRIVVRRVVLMKGYQFPDRYERHDREPMVAFGVNKAANAPDPFPPVGFREERAFWRDSLAFLQTVTQDGRRPRTLAWLGELASEGYLDRSDRLQIDVLGLAADRAKLLFWRHERLALPVAYLEETVRDHPLFDALREALDLSERVGRLLRAGLVEVWVDGKRLNTNNKPVWGASPARILAEKLLGANGPVGDLIEHLAPERRYWSRLDGPFQTLLFSLPEDMAVDQLGDQHFGGTVLPRWAEAVEQAASAAFEEAVRGLESSAKGLEAVARAERELRRLLRGMVAIFRPEVEMRGGVA